MSTLPSVLRTLDLAGYELVGEGRRSKSSAPLHRVLETLLTQYGDDRRLVNGVPVLLAKATESQLQDLAKLKPGIISPASYLVETTASVLQRMGEHEAEAARLAAQLPYLRQHASRQEYIIPKGLGAAKIASLRRERSDIARRWRVVDFDRELEFQDLLERYL